MKLTVTQIEANLSVVTQKSHKVQSALNCNVENVRVLLAKSYQVLDGFREVLYSSFQLPDLDSHLTCAKGVKMLRQKDKKKIERLVASGIPQPKHRNSTHVVLPLRSVAWKEWKASRKYPHSPAYHVVSRTAFWSGLPKPLSNQMAKRELNQPPLFAFWFDIGFGQPRPKRHRWNNIMLVSVCICFMIMMSQ